MMFATNASDAATTAPATTGQAPSPTVEGQAAPQAPAAGGAPQAAGTPGSGPAGGGWLSVLLARMGLGSGSLRETLEHALATETDSERSAFSSEERQMLLRLLRFGTLRVDDVMVPRADIVGVEIGAPLGELVGIFRDAQHSRLPLYRETLDDPVGMVHIKDALALLAPADGKPVAGDNILSRIRREVLFVPPSMRVVDLLIKMQKTRIHMALVIDEYGGTDGLVTIEDLVEEIVGDIEDEHDVEETPLLVTRPDNGFDASGRLAIEDLEKALGMTLLSETREEDIDTLGGLLFSLVGRVPQRGEIITHPKGAEFEILDADPRRVKKVRVHPKLSASSGELQAAPDELAVRADDVR